MTRQATSTTQSTMANATSTKHLPRPHGDSVRTLLSKFAMGGSLLALAVACNDTVTPTIITSNPGEVIVNPLNGRRVIVDQSYGGLTPDLRLERISWGRLVNVFALGAQPGDPKILTNVDLVIDPAVQTSAGFYELNSTTLTGKDELTILRTLDGGSQEESFNTLLRQLSEGLEPVADVGFSTSGFFTAIPRNAALQITFNDLLDPSTINERSLRILVGAPSTVPFESRIIVDPNHGDVLDTNHDGALAFHPTRVVLDLTISEVESFSTDPPLAPNAIGLPASITASVANLQLRIPTVINPILGQDVLVSNLTAHHIEPLGAGTVDYSDPLLPIMRNARSGGSEGLTGDAYNGFLIDNNPPSIVGVFDGAILQVPQQQTQQTQFIIPVMRFDSQNCAQQLDNGDVLVQGAVVAQVMQPSGAPLGPDIGSVRVELLQWPPAWGDNPSEWTSIAVQPVTIHSAWDADLDTGNEACFITLRPEALGAPENPTSQAHVSTKVSVRFSEPMASDTMEAFESLRLTRKSLSAPDFGSHDWVVAAILANTSLDSFELTPDLPLAHAAGSAEVYTFSMNPDDNGATDLAGNPLSSTLPEVPITLWTGGEAVVNGGRASRYTSHDEDLQIADPITAAFPYAEWGGEIVFQSALGIIRPRPVSRFMGVVAREPAETANGKPAYSGFTTINAMPVNATRVIDPLSRFGSKTHFIWRFMDVGFNMIERGPGLDVDDPTDDLYITDPSTYNLDVEGLWWAPKSGTPVIDSFDVIEMRMSHGFFQPDEWVVGPPYIVPFADSGLVPTFTNNMLSVSEDPQRIVHTRDLGYIISPGELIQVGTNTNLMPWPMNKTIPPSEHRYYTWRDTGLRTRGGPGNGGVDMQRWYETNPEITQPIQPPPGIDVCDDPMNPPVAHPFYSTEQIQSIALPLLVEVRCFSDLAASGANDFDTNIAPPPVYTGLQPYFRAFSTGGEPAGSDDAFIVNPDLQDFANGGFDSTSVPPGDPTPGLDNYVYIGALDFVVRTSRSHSIWWEVLDANGENFPNGLINNPTFNPPVLEPRAELLPVGTSIQVSFRGASGVTTSPGPPPIETDPAFQVREAATMLDRYGDHYVDTSSICDNSIDHDAFSALTGVLQVNTPITFTNNDTWQDDVAQINGSFYYQVRLTFTSNATSGISPYLSAFGLTWQQ